MTPKLIPIKKKMKYLKIPKKKNNNNNIWPQSIQLIYMDLMFLKFAKVL